MRAALLNTAALPRWCEREICRQLEGSAKRGTSNTTGTLGHGRRRIARFARPLNTGQGTPVTAGGAQPRIRIAVSTYWYWHIRTAKYPVEQVIEHAARLGFDGVEILHRQMTDDSPAYINKLKQLAFRHGLALPMLSIHQDFVSDKTEERQADVAHTIRCIELAARLGIPAIRLNSGRWNTIASFDDLMKVKGDEPPIKGFTDEDAFRWCIEGIQACLPAAEQHGVLLALENHWGLTTKTENLLRNYKAVNCRGWGSTWIRQLRRRSVS